MKFVKSFEANYIERGSGNFSKLVDLEFKPNSYAMSFERTDYHPFVFGTVITLESAEEVVIPRRSAEVTGYKNAFATFTGATPFGLTDFEDWASERVKQESNHSPRLEFIGLLWDVQDQSTPLAYRGFVDKIDREKLPTSVKSQYGVMKYSELCVVPKSELPEFLHENKNNFMAFAEILLSYVASENLSRIRKVG